MTILTPDDVLNSRFVGDFGRLRPFVAPRAVVVAERFESAHSLCDIQWGSDGSVYLLFPYLQDVPGIVSRASLQNGHAGSHTITLAETARTTSNVVKLSHHRSGIAQLSQSGRTTSEIRVSSLPLDGGNGRIFEVTAFNPLEYPTTSLADRPLERVHLRTMFSRGMPPAVSVVALWFRCDELAQRLPAGQTAGRATRSLHC